jgi:cold shock protein
MTQGRVSWFTSSKGYGFVKPVGTETEIFVHHSGIESDGYKYLVEGEYVDFVVEETDGKKKATRVRGIGGGPLMCETRERKLREGKERSKSEPGPKSVSLPSEL